MTEHKLFAVLTGHTDTWIRITCGKRLSYELIDFMVDKLPEAWGKYIFWTYDNKATHDGFNYYHIGPTFINEVLSLSNLYAYILAHEEMFWEECPECYGQGSVELGHIPEAMTTMHCDNCNGSGKTVKPGFEKVVEYLKEGKE